MQIKKIITHAGIFHADEITAIAFMRLMGIDVPIECKFQISQEEINDPEVWILDVGMVQDFKNHNFDHHHPTQKESPATNKLILDYFYQNGYIDEQIYLMFKKRFFDFISHC